MLNITIASRGAHSIKNHFFSNAAPHPFLMASTPMIVSRDSHRHHHRMVALAHHHVYVGGGHRLNRSATRIVVSAHSQLYFITHTYIWIKCPCAP